MRNLQLVLGVAAITSVSCGSVIYDRPVDRRADGWQIRLSEVKDGPNSYATGGQITYKPGDGERFLRARLTFRNETAQKRDFSYDACSFDLGSEEVLPVLVDRDLVIQGLTDKVEDFAPGEERTRVLIFSYPDDRLPTRLRCAFASFDLPKR